MTSGRSCRLRPGLRPAWRRQLFALGGVLAALVLAVVARGTTYYVDATDGSDASAGDRPADAWRSLARASRAPLQPGDELRLARGQTHRGQLRLAQLRGTVAAPITIGSYARTSAQPEGRATIDGRGTPAALHLLDCSGVIVTDLALSADGPGEAAPVGSPPDFRCGVLVEAVAPAEYAHLTLRNLRVGAVSYHEPGFRRPAADVKTANGQGRYGYGIRFIARHEGARLTHVAVRQCVIERVDHTGLKFTGPSGSIRDVEVEAVRVANVGGPGIQLSGVVDGHVHHVAVDHSGSESDGRNWGRGSGLWTWGCRGILVERSEFRDANGPGDSAGVHIDYRCRDVVVQYNLSANNAGGFCEILGDNHNCAYRYNVSINDGARVKGRRGAFQEGKTLWLSGYVGKAKPTGPFNTYIYNNTLFLAADQEAKIAVAPSAAGVLIMNNIFCFQGASRAVAGDQFRVDPLGGAAAGRVVFANNAFLRADNWPRELAVQDTAPLIGDPAFVHPGGGRAEDYVPRNLALVRDRGLPVPCLPDDPVGLRIGLPVTVDFLGRPIIGAPDIGAIEVP